jgi:malonate transporter and related proteins
LPSLAKEGKRAIVVEILNIALPFFGLVLLGLIAGRIWARDEDGLVWLNIFVLYFALPPLIFMVVSQTPLEKLANPAFVMATAGSTAVCFLMMFVLARRVFDVPVRESALRGTSAAYGNVGYMGPRCQRRLCSALTARCCLY